MPDNGLAAFIDVETTGLSPATDEVVELAVCLFEFRRDTGEITRIVDRYVGLRQPATPIPPDAFAIHGISNRAVKGKRLDEGRIVEMLEKAEFLVAHNAPFDRGFVVRLFDACVAMPWLCSMSGINWYRKGFRSRGLQQLLAAHGIEPRSSHRADSDVDAAIELLRRHEGDGKSYFAELIERLPQAGRQEPS
ncbi:MAG: hypothetical protein HYX92_02360 [Chloroflexi bacterium]|nr:hypothetical protein [Chloroflexota bacterium]